MAARKQYLHQIDSQIINSLSAPSAGFIGFSAKAGGLYQKMFAGEDEKLLVLRDLPVASISAPGMVFYASLEEAIAGILPDKAISPESLMATLSVSYVPYYGAKDDLDMGEFGVTASLLSTPLGNSTNWNTAFGWGNHAGLYAALNHGDHGLAAHAALTTTAHGLGQSAFHPDAFFALAGHIHEGMGTGAVESVFGRTGVVAAQSGDYTVTQITGAANLNATNDFKSSQFITAPGATLALFNTLVGGTSSGVTFYNDSAPATLVAQFGYNRSFAEAYFWTSLASAAPIKIMPGGTETARFCTSAVLEMFNLTATPAATRENFGGFYSKNGLPYFMYNSVETLLSGGSGGLWAADAYGISYNVASKNVGIGVASNFATKLFVSGNNNEYTSFFSSYGPSGKGVMISVSDAYQALSIIPKSIGSDSLTIFGNGVVQMFTSTPVVPTVTGTGMLYVDSNSKLRWRTSTANYDLTEVGSGTTSGMANPMTTTGDLIQATAGTTPTRLAAAAYGNVLLSGGAGVISSWGKVNLASHITGNLPVASLNSGSSASATTFWCGDGTWKTPATNVGSVAWGSITGSISSQSDLISALNAKQATLVSGSNLSTVNGYSLLSGVAITIEGGTSVFDNTLYATIKNISPVGGFECAHASAKNGDFIYVGERVYMNRSDLMARVIKYNANTLVEVSAYNVGLGKSVESMCYDTVRSRIYTTRFTWNADPVNIKLEILEIEPSTMTLVGSVHVYSTITAGGSPAIVTDGVYIYGVTYTDPSKFFKIRISDWALITTSTWTGRERGHAATINTRTGKMYVTTIPYSSTTATYFASVSLSDLSYAEVNLSTYLKKATDDFAMIDTGTEVWCYVGGEVAVAGYGGARIKLSDMSLTGIPLKETFCLAAEGTTVYSTSLDGTLQVFDGFDLNNIFNYKLNGYTANEVLTSSDGRVWVTNFDTGYDESKGKLIEVILPGLWNRVFASGGSVAFAGIGGEYGTAGTVARSDHSHPYISSNGQVTTGPGDALAYLNPNYFSMSGGWKPTVLSTPTAYSDKPFSAAGAFTEFAKKAELAGNYQQDFSVQRLLLGTTSSSAGWNIRKGTSNLEFYYDGILKAVLTSTGVFKAVEVERGLV